MLFFVKTRNLPAKCAVPLTKQLVYRHGGDPRLHFLNRYLMAGTLETTQPQLVEKELLPVVAYKLRDVHLAYPDSGALFRFGEF